MSLGNFGIIVLPYLFLNSNWVASRQVILEAHVGEIVTLYERCVNDVECAPGDSTFLFSRAYFAFPAFYIALHLED